MRQQTEENELATISTIERQTRERLKFETNAAARPKNTNWKKLYPSLISLAPVVGVGLPWQLSAGTAPPVSSLARSPEKIMCPSALG